MIKARLICFSVLLSFCLIVQQRAHACTVIGPRCGRDCGDFNDDGATDILDLLVLLDGWKELPVAHPYGVVDFLNFSDNWNTGPLSSGSPIKYEIFDSGTNVCHADLLPVGPADMVPDIGASFRVVVTFPLSVPIGSTATLYTCYEWPCDETHPCPDGMAPPGGNGSGYGLVVDGDHQATFIAYFGIPFGAWDLLPFDEGRATEWNEHVTIIAGDLVSEYDNRIAIELQPYIWDYVTSGPPPHYITQTTRIDINYANIRGNVTGDINVECVQSHTTTYP